MAFGLPIVTDSTRDMLRDAANEALANNPLVGLSSLGTRELGEWYTDKTVDVFGDIANTANRVGMEQDVTAARRDADRAADVTKGIFDRRTEGMALSDRQKMGATQRLNLGREVTKAAASYSTRKSATDRARAAQKAMGFGFEDITFGQQVGALTGMANAEGQRIVREANERAAKKERRNGLFGDIVGFVTSIFGSSETFKAPTETNPQLLEKLKKVRVDKWKYHGGDRDHIGPYAEEFNQTFGVGKDHQKYLDVVDVLGVALGAVKELNEKVEAANRG